MRRRGTPFAGLLYIGLAVTSQGPGVVEFNARFGDPETQVVLALLDTPLAAVLRWAATGGEPPKLTWRDASAVTVVRAAAGYPDSPRTGDVITGSEQDGVIHAGTRRRHDGAVVSSGGRVLSITAVGATLAEARDNAYRLAATRRAARRAAAQRHSAARGRRVDYRLGSGWGRVRRRRRSCRCAAGAASTPRPASTWTARIAAVRCRDRRDRRLGGHPAVATRADTAGRSGHHPAAAPRRTEARAAARPHAR